jgi:cbb3-type cytochrome oxidase maturation protein
VSLGFLIALSLALGIAAWLGFLWSVKNGQYDDPEGPKYRMLDDDDGRTHTTQRGPDTERMAGKKPRE